MFIDVDALQPGDDFVDAITERLAGCDLMLVVIGRRWLTIADEKGRPRLHEDYDYVRLEIEAALARRVRTIPVLVERAEMPRAEDLPERLQPLVRRHAIELSDTRWDYDIGVLIENIRQMTAPPEPAANPDPPPPSDWRPWMLRAAGVAAVAVAAALVWWGTAGRGRQVPEPPPQNTTATLPSGVGAASQPALEPSASVPSPASPAATTATFTTAAGMLFVPVKADQAAVFEEMAMQLKTGLARSRDAAVREQGAGIRIFRATGLAGANPLYVMLMEAVRAGADYEPLGLISKTVPPGPDQAAQVNALSTRYRAAFVSGVSKMSLTPLAAKPEAEPAPSQPAAGGAKVTFTTPVGVILVPVKPEATGTFEEIAVKIIAGVRGTRDRDFKSQMSGLQIFRAVEPSREGHVIYVMLIDPVTPNAEYDPLQVLAKTMTPEQLHAPETTETWKRYTDAIAGAFETMSLAPVAGLETSQPIR